MRQTPMLLDKSRDQRRAQRKRVLWSGTVDYDGKTWPCVILDLSATGAKIRVERAEARAAVASIPVHATLALSSKHFEALRLKLMWRQRDLAGLQFIEAPTRIATSLAHVLPLFRSDGAPMPPTQLV